MLYAILCEDVPNSLPLRRASRPAHLARLDALQKEGRLILAGPHPAVDCEEPGESGFTGSLIVAEFPTHEDAEQWAGQDPYLAAGVYDRVTVKPFKMVLPR